MTEHDELPDQPLDAPPVPPLAPASTATYYSVQAEYFFQVGTLYALPNGPLWTFLDRAEAVEYIKDLHDGRLRNGLYFLRHSEYARPVYTIVPLNETQLNALYREHYKGIRDSHFVSSTLWKKEVGRQALEESRRGLEKVDEMVIANAPAARREATAKDLRKSREREDANWYIYPPRRR